MENKMENEMEVVVIKGLYRDPSIQRQPTLSSKVCNNFTYVGLIGSLGFIPYVISRLPRLADSVSVCFFTRASLSSKFLGGGEYEGQIRSKHRSCSNDTPPHAVDTNNPAQNTIITEMQRDFLHPP